MEFYMLESVLGSISCERVLVFLAARDEGYAREIATFFATSLAPLKNNLTNLSLEGCS